MDITIRRAQKRDLPSVLKLYAEIDIDNIAEYDGRPVGTFALSIMHNLAQNMGTVFSLNYRMIFS
jgi:hypothetical protein